MRLTVVVTTLAMLCVFSSADAWGPWCYLMGPRFKTFDNKYMRFKDTCPAKAFELCDPTKLKEVGSCLPNDFSIEIDEITTWDMIYPQWGSGSGTVIRNVKITIDNQEIIFGYDQITVNGDVVDFPYFYPDSTNPIFTLTGSNPEGISGSRKQLLLCDGSMLMLGSCWYFVPSATLLKAAKGNSCGICGFFDGNVLNDLRLPDGSQASSIDDFFKGWTPKGNGNANSLGVKKCPSLPGKKRTHCPPGQLKQAEKLCSVIKDKTGPFKTCNSDLVSTFSWITWYIDYHYDACINLACHNQGKALKEAACLKLDETEMICNSWIQYVNRYRNANIARVEDTTCPKTCDKDMHWDNCAKPECNPSCDNPTGVSQPWFCRYGGTRYCMPGCVCDEGLLWNGKRCVRRC